MQSHLGRSLGGNELTIFPLIEGILDLGNISGSQEELRKLILGLRKRINITGGCFILYPIRLSVLGVRCFFTSTNWAVTPSVLLFLEKSSF